MMRTYKGVLAIYPIRSVALQVSKRERIRFSSEIFAQAIIENIVVSHAGKQGHR